MPSGKRVYFARAIEGIELSQIIRVADSARYDLQQSDLILVDANREYRTWRAGSDVTSGEEHNVLVPFQIELLQSCDALLVDMTIPLRNYIGCCCEIVYARMQEMPIAVYVEDTHYGLRKWLRYHADVVVPHRREAIAYLCEALAMREQLDVNGGLRD